MIGITVQTTQSAAISVRDGFQGHFELRQFGGEQLVTCANQDAPALIAAIAQQAGVTIEQIAEAMGVPGHTGLPWILVSERLPEAEGNYDVTLRDGTLSTWRFMQGSTGCDGEDYWRYWVTAWAPSRIAHKAEQ